MFRPEIEMLNQSKYIKMKNEVEHNQNASDTGLNIDSVSGYILVRNKYFQNSVDVASNSPFFSYPIIVKDFGDKIVITHPSMDYRGKLNSLSLHKGFYNGSFIANIPPGKYFFDQDESDEDTLVVYYR